MTINKANEIGALNGEAFIKEMDKYLNISYDIICSAFYEGRYLFLVKYYSLEKEKSYYGLFYKSSGSCTPDRCAKGSVRPIIGLMDERYPRMYRRMAELFPTMVNYDGWIGKPGSKDANDPKSFFCDLKQKYISIKLENEPIKNKICLDEFLDITECYYTRENFYPNIVKKEKV